MKPPARVYVAIDDDGDPQDVTVKRPTTPASEFFGWVTTWHVYRLDTPKPAAKKPRKAKRG